MTAQAGKSKSPSRAPAAAPAPPALAPADSASRLRAWFLALSLLAAGLAVYANSLSAEFIYDDSMWIVKDDRLRDFGSLPDLLRDTRPLVRLTLLLNHAADRWLAPRLRGDDPADPHPDAVHDGLHVAGYHAFNLAVHLAAGLLLFALVRRTLRLYPHPPFGRAAALPAPDLLAFLVALLWLIHPLQTQAVTYVSQRCESLMGLFYLLLLYAVHRCAGATDKRSLRSLSVETKERTRSPLTSSEDFACQWHPAAFFWAALAVLCCFLGMLTKEVMAVAPLVALLYDRTFLAGSFAAALRRRWGLYLALFLVTAAMTLVVLRPLVRPIEGASAGLHIEQVRWWQYALTQPGVILHYLRLAVWPDPLIFDYQWPVLAPLVAPASESARNLLLGGQIAVIAVLLGLALWACWRRPALGFLGLSFFLILAPTSSLMPIADLAVEHRMYLPLAPLLVLLVLGGAAIADRLGAARPGRPAFPVAALAAALTVAALLGWRTIFRNHDYRTAASLWHSVLVHRPDNFRAHHNLGTALAEDKNGDPAAKRHSLEEAVRCFQRALDHNPGYPDSQDSLLAVLLDRNRNQEAQRYLERWLPTRPPEPGTGYATLAYCAGRVFLNQDLAAEALPWFEEAVRYRPEYPEAWNNRGYCLYALAQARGDQGLFDAALASFGEALKINPDFLDARHNRARLLVNLHLFDQAIADYLRALRADPTHPVVRGNLADALWLAGRRAEARAVLQRGLQLCPDDPGLRQRQTALDAGGGLPLSPAAPGP